MCAERRCPGQVVAAAVAGQCVGCAVLGAVGRIRIQAEDNAADRCRAGVGADIDVLCANETEVDSLGDQVVERADVLVRVRVDQGEARDRLGRLWVGGVDNFWRSVAQFTVG